MNQGFFGRWIGERRWIWKTIATSGRPGSHAVQCLGIQKHLHDCHASGSRTREFAAAVHEREARCPPSIGFPQE
jgi:hypothetical protein